MLSRLRRTLPILLFVIAIFFVGCSDESRISNPTTTNSSTAIKSAPTDYYDSVDDSDAATLRASLHEIIDDHTRYPYTSSSTDTWNILELADEDPNDSSCILDVYLNASYTKHGAGNDDYNREHTWPKSYGFPDESSSNYPYTDCHHLFLSNDSYNTSRSNKPYRNCDSGCTEKPTEENDGMGGGSGEYPGNSNWTTGSYTSGSWETWIGRRGDVARALLYMDIRYEGGTHGVTGASEPDLILTDDEDLIDASNTGENLSVAYMGMLSVLLEWHAEDPVDDREMARNDAVYTYQGNRNPFIDHPEWVDCIFSGDCSGGSGDTTPPAAPEGLAATAGDGSVTLNWDDNSESDLAGYSVYRSTTSGGSYSAVTGTLLSASNYTDSSVTSGVTYYYIVTATDDSSNESTESDEASATPTGGGTGGDTIAWINEFHYDNDGTDTGEFFEIAGTAGLDLSGWSVVGYNGNGGVVYDTVDLSGTLADQSNGFGTLSFSMTGMQNGSPDGLALVDDAGDVVLFISYEGSVTATDGPASGTTSTDIGVTESSTTTIGYSLQLVGDGTTYEDFTWQDPAVDSPGEVNSGQTFDGGSTPVNEAPTAEANGPYSGDEGAAITFSSDGSTDSDGTIVSWLWSFGDGSTSTTANPSHTYDTAGTYTATLTVTDDDGATDSDTATVTVSEVAQPNEAPTAEANGPYSGDEGAAITLSSDGSTDSDGTIVSWLWSFGDGSTSTTADPSHTYDTAGTYTATLTVTDDDGATDSDTATVTVSEVSSDQLMHVDSVEVGCTGARTRYGYAEVTVVDAAGDPVAGVTVTGTFSGRLRGTYTGVTDSDGVVVITNPGRFNPRSSFTFCVDDLELTGWTYDSSANNETCGTYGW